MFISEELFQTGCQAVGFFPDAETVLRFDTYARLLVSYNEKVNLTAITAPDEIVNKHFIDSLYLLKFLPIVDGMTLCDVGTGAGFPGAALLCAKPTLRVTLFDSINKKLDFIRLLTAELGLSAEIVQIRAEDAGKQPQYREAFQIVTARAVAQLNVLSEYCVPLVQQGGCFAPLKAVMSPEEEQRGFGAAVTLGAKKASTERYLLPDGSERQLTVFQKISSTPARYPRNAAQIAKKPL